VVGVVVDPDSIVLARDGRGQFLVYDAESKARAGKSGRTLATIRSTSRTTTRTPRTSGTRTTKTRGDDFELVDVD